MYLGYESGQIVLFDSRHLSKQVHILLLYFLFTFYRPFCLGSTIFLLNCRTLQCPCFKVCFRKFPQGI